MQKKKKKYQSVGRIQQNMYYYITSFYVDIKWYENTTFILQVSRVKSS